MLFKRVPPSPEAAHLVRELWIVEDDDQSTTMQKIIPDGYCEIVIHYGDPYRIQLTDHWEEQSRLLLSTQITRHFFLENTGVSGMLGIKLMPSAPYHLFEPDMPSLTDRVVNLREVARQDIALLESITVGDVSADTRLAMAEEWIASRVAKFAHGAMPLAEVVQSIIDAHGMIDVGILARSHAMGRRTLERAFKRIVGISPKLFARIQQFNYIFEAMKQHDNSWIDVALNSGYFDQSHFIKNFKAFTGEQPSQYGFDEENMANFFLKR